MASFNDLFGNPLPNNGIELTPAATAPTPADGKGNDDASNAKKDNNNNIASKGKPQFAPIAESANGADGAGSSAVAAAARPGLGARKLTKGASFFQRLAGKKEPERIITTLSPAELKVARAKEIGLEPPINLAEVWSVERGVSEMEEWPEKIGGYRELLFYLFFYIIYCIIQVMQCNPFAAYAVNTALQDVVSGYDTVAYQSDWFTWAQGVLDTIFTPSWYNGDPYTTEETGFISYYNKLIGGVLLVQTRGASVDCPNSLYNAFYGDCHGDQLTTGNFSTLSTSAPTNYTYDTEQQGYTQFFSVALTQTQVDNQFAALQQSRWLDKNTRTVTMKFAVYNGEYGLFAFAAVTMTFGIGGVMFGNNQAQIQATSFEIYRTQDDWARLGLECLFLFMASWLFSEEMIDLFDTVMRPRVGPSGKLERNLATGLKAYLRSLWNYLDLLNHGLMFTYIGQRITYVIYLFQNPIELPTNKYQQELEVVASMQNALLLIISLNIFVKILHLFKYFAFQPRMNILSSTIALALPDLFHFFILFGCVFLSYAVMGMLLFGPHLPGYSSFGLITETLGEYLMGQFDYDTPSAGYGTHDINPLMATLVFWSYVVIVCFVLINVFLAILIDAYADAKSKASDATGIPDDIGRMLIQTFSSRPKGVGRDPLRDALQFFQKKGITAIETKDIEWFLEQQYGVQDEKFLMKNEGLLRAMQCRIDKDTPNCEMTALLQAAWAKYDADGSGYLDRAEFAAFLKDAPVKTRQEDEAKIDQLLRDADVNGDGLVSFDEFVPVFHAVMLDGLATAARTELQKQSFSKQMAPMASGTGSAVLARGSAHWRGNAPGLGSGNGATRQASA